MPTLKSVAPPWSAAIVQLPLTLCYSILQMPDSLTSTKTGENDIWLPHIHLSPQKSRGHHSPLILHNIICFEGPYLQNMENGITGLCETCYLRICFLNINCILEHI